MRYHFTIVALFAAPALAAAPQDEDQRLLARFKEITYGDYWLRTHERPLPGPEDVERCARGLAHRAAAIQGHACLAIESLVGEAFFARTDPVQIEELLSGVIARLASPADRTAEWAGRAVAAFARNTAFLRGRHLDSACTQGLALLGSRFADPRRRGANLFAALLPLLAEEPRCRAIEALLAAAEEYGTAAALDDRQLAALDCLMRTVSVTEPREPALATRIARRILADLAAPADQRGRVHGSTRARYSGLARQVPRLETALRRRAIDRIILALSDESLLYTLTSGRPSPFEHSAVDALTPLVPRLDPEQTRRALERCRKAAAQMDRWAEPRNLEPSPSCFLALQVLLEAHARR